MVSTLSLGVGAVLPKGAELVKAVGESGFRGFSRTGGKTAHAVFKPVAVTGALVAGWPALAVAGVVFVADMAAHHELRAHQRRVEGLLGRQEEREYRNRIANQISTDEQLSRAISLMLDGRHSQLELLLLLKDASAEFSLAQQFLQAYGGVVEALTDEDGKVDYRRLEQALGGREKDVDYFVRELHLSQAAIALQRKAIVSDAAGRALDDPGNPYLALRRYYEEKVGALGEAEASVNELVERLSKVELKGRWHDAVRARFQGSEKSVSAREKRFRDQIAPPTVKGDTEIQYVVLASGELHQVVDADEDGILQLEREQ